MGIPKPPPLPSVTNKISGCIEDVIHTTDKGIKADLLKFWMIMQSSEDIHRIEQLSLFPFECILQDGPTCGLACIAMITTLTGKPCTIEYILNLAKAHEYTKCGEMFCTKDMVSLTSSVLADTCDVMHIQRDIQSIKEEIVADLLHGRSFYLFAYDADKNNAPAVLNGHSAHWGLACGALISTENTYLICRQGKSRHMGVWLFDEISQSNKNLCQICPERTADPAKYVLHEISKTLANQLIKITPHIPFRILNKIDIWGL